YYFNIKEVFENHGHHVIPFSIKGSRNFTSPYDHYFLSGVDGESYFSQYTKTPITILKSFGRMFYSFEAKRKFMSLLIKEEPDIVYIMQYHNKISPSIIIAAKELDIPVVHRISDFQYICANALFHNETIGLCEKCLTGSKWNAVRYKCVLNSRLYSFIKITAQKLHEMINITGKINAFVVPSKFTFSKLSTFGIAESKLFHIPTFYKTSDEKSKEFKINYGDFALYVGRIEEEKGIITLVKAFENTNMTLKIIGFSSNGYDINVKEYLSGKDHNIEFLGKLSFDKVKKYLCECAFTICPSECYDNFPNSVLESYAFQKPVIASNIGSLKELILDGKTGFFFEAGNFIDLRTKVKFLFSNTDLCKRMGKNVINYLEENYSEDSHYRKLMKVFNSLVKN
ncbi:MAG TPA: glycosyltransferase family 4 protein, partial [Ignavibacteria bacterium]